MCISQNPKSSTETGGFRKMRSGQNRKKKQNAQPIFSVLLQMSHPLGSHLLHSQTVLAQKLLLMGGAEGINQAEIICPPSPLSSSDVCCLPPLPHGSCTLCWWGVADTDCVCHEDGLSKCSWQKLLTSTTMTIMAVLWARDHDDGRSSMCFEGEGVGVNFNESVLNY